MILQSGSWASIWEVSVSLFLQASGNWEGHFRTAAVITNEEIRKRTEGCGILP